MSKIFCSYSMYYKNYIWSLVEEIRKYGIETINSELDLLENDDFTGAIINQIRKSDALIAFIDNDTSTVFLEIGYAIGIGKPVLIINLSDIELPLHLRKFSYLKVNIDDKSDLVNIVMKIQDLIKKTRSQQSFQINYGSGEEALKMLSIDSNYLQGIEVLEFENILFRWYQQKGYDIQRAGRGDFGFDFIINLDGERFLVEAKKYSSNSNISVMNVQQLLGAIHAYNASGGIIITTSSYTKSAIDFAEKCFPKISLLNIQDLINKDVPL